MQFVANTSGAEFFSSKEKIIGAHTKHAVYCKELSPTEIADGYFYKGHNACTGNEIRRYRYTKRHAAMSNF